MCLCLSVCAYAPVVRCHRVPHGCHDLHNNVSAFLASHRRSISPLRCSNHPRSERGALGPRHTRCASPYSYKMRAGRACVRVCVCNRGREVKGEGCTRKGRRVKWKEKAISPLSQLVQTPFFCSAEGETFPFLRLLFPCLLLSLPLLISVPLSRLPRLFVCRHCGPPVRWRDGEIAVEGRWGVADGGAQWGRFEDLNGLYLLTYFLSPDWLKGRNSIKMYLIKEHW